MKDREPPLLKFNSHGEQMYPTLEEVETADQLQLAQWYRFLKSPGSSAIGQDNFEDVLEQEVKTMNRIRERFEGFTPELSKSIGWASG